MSRALVPFIAAALTAAALLLLDVGTLPVAFAQEGGYPLPTEEEIKARDELIAKACDPSKKKYVVRPDKASKPIPTAPPDKALIFVIQPQKPFRLPKDLVVRFVVSFAVDGRWIGANSWNTYFFFTLDPGEHYFCSQAANQSPLSLTVAAGQTYYLQQRLEPTLFRTDNWLVAIDERKGRKALTKCNLSVF